MHFIFVLRLEAFKYILIFLTKCFLKKKRFLQNFPIKTHYVKMDYLILVCIKIGTCIVLVLHFNPWVEASVGGL